MNKQWKRNNLKKVARRKARVAKRQAMTRQWIHRCMMHGGTPRSKQVFEIRRPQKTSPQQDTGVNWIMSKFRRQAGKQPLMRQKKVAA